MPLAGVGAPLLASGVILLFWVLFVALCLTPDPPQMPVRSRGLIWLVLFLEGPGEVLDLLLAGFKLGPDLAHLDV